MKSVNCNDVSDQQPLDHDTLGIYLVSVSLLRVTPTVGKNHCTVRFELVQHGLKAYPVPTHNTSQVVTRPYWLPGEGGDSG